MHTATKLAEPLITDARRQAPHARLVCFGLYAPLNHQLLQGLGADFVLGGEFEAALARIADGNGASGTSLDRLQFELPWREELSRLGDYSRLIVLGETRTAGYTEASRGCKHLCRHCPVVPVYRGSFRVVQAEVVLADVRQQVKAGARHITFGDPDFFNGPAHARRIVEALHAEFPDVTYDVTVKVEHLLRHRALLPVLRQSGCLFVTSAAESLDDEVLAKLQKRHTRADFIQALALCRAEGLAMVPTFIPFTPWTTRESYQDLLHSLAELDLLESVPSVQLALRLLIPNESRMLDLEDVVACIERYDAKGLLYRWRHPDSHVDRLAQDALQLVHQGQRAGRSRMRIFEDLWKLAFGERMAENYKLMPRATVPYLDEPWYC